MHWCNFGTGNQIGALYALSMQTYFMLLLCEYSNWVRGDAYARMHARMHAHYPSPGLLMHYELRGNFWVRICIAMLLTRICDEGAEMHGFNCPGLLQTSWHVALDKQVISFGSGYLCRFGYCSPVMSRARRAIVPLARRSDFQTPHLCLICLAHWTPANSQLPSTYAFKLLLGSYSSVSRVNHLLNLSFIGFGEVLVLPACGGWFL